MKRFYKYAGWLFVALLFLRGDLFADNNLVICNDSLINERAVGEIEKIGSEVKLKSGVNIYVCAKKDIGGQKIKDYEKNLSNKIKKPFILFTLAADEQKVDIYTSSESKKALSKDDVDSILNPFTGTVIPILTSKKSKDKYSAAMLNGYADIADRVADNLGFKLKSSVGNTNRILVNILRVIIYGSFLYFIIVYTKRKFFKRERNEKK